MKIFFSFLLVCFTVQSVNASSTRVSCFKAFKAMVGNTQLSSMPSRNQVVDKCIKANTANLAYCISSGSVAYGLSPETSDDMCGTSSTKADLIKCKTVKVSPTIFSKNNGMLVNAQEFISCEDNIKVKGTILKNKQTVVF